MKAEVRAVWEQLFEDISLFDDFRHFKAEQGGTGADFRHKETGLGLWWDTASFSHQTVLLA